jgi:hypothetical protein
LIEHLIDCHPELKRGFVSDGCANKVTIFDLKSLRTTGHQPFIVPGTLAILVVSQ